MNPSLIRLEMKVVVVGCYLLVTISCLLLASGLRVHSLSYDYFATTECLAESPKAQYGGGIIVNPNFDDNIEGWRVFGNGTIEERISNEGNRFIVARNRTQPLDSFSQKIQLTKGTTYTLSAWIQLSEGSEFVSVIFKMNGSEVIRAGHVIAKHGCWSMLKGGIFANFSSSAEILFESKNPNVEIWADSVSLQPFTKKQWRSHQDHSIERVRKSRVRFQITHENKTAMAGAAVLITQRLPGFPFGCGMNSHILTNSDYQKWFVQRFKYTAFTNEMKWYSNEKIQGQENYTIPDAMVRFAKENGIAVRGHCVLWDDKKFNPKWVQSLSPDELRAAAKKRMRSVVTRYWGQLIAWDVVNENMHYHFFEDNLGQNASAQYYLEAFLLDVNVILFLNEFNTIEYSGEKFASPANYVRKIQEIQQYARYAASLASLPLGIGLQAHFAPGQPNLAYMRSGLDLLGATGLPIWLTETSVEPQANQAEYFEEVLREAFSHPSVDGIIIFAGPAQAGFYGTLLADQNFQNTPTGNVVDKLINEWKTGPHKAIADSKGIVDISLYHGEYDVIVTNPLTHHSKTMNISVRKGPSQKTIHVKMDPNTANHSC